MSTTLSQSSDAGFPDRPRDGGSGLLVRLDPGTDAAYLAHEFHAPHHPLHVRFMLAPRTVGGGEVVLLVAFDAAGDEAIRLTLHPDTHRITATLGTGVPLVADLPAALAWHCVELGFDPGHAAMLSVNGVPSATAPADPLPAIAAIWFGAPAKHRDAAGELALDELVLSGSSIGPVVVAPASPHADDPARWLVVYNADHPDAATWAEHYRAARGVPYANLLGLHLPLAQTIDTAAYASLAASVRGYLDATRLGEQVVGVLCGYAVPGYVRDEPGDVPRAVASLLQHIADDGSLWPTANPLAVDAQPTRVTPAALAGRLLTARIDAATLPDAIAVTDRATAVMASPLAPEAGGRVWFDAYPPFASTADPIAANQRAWARSPERQRLRLPFTFSGDLAVEPPPPGPGPTFDAVSDDAVVWAWHEAEASADFFADPAGRRVVCVQLWTGPGVTSLREAAAGGWAAAAVRAGYAAAITATGSISPAALPLPRAFFHALNAGWPLAEALFVASPLLRQGLTLTGDPLLRPVMPREGFDIFGPVASLEALDLDSPAAMLPADARSLGADAMQQLGEGEAGMWLVRRRDSEGRDDGGAATVRVASVAGVAASPPMGPAWPDAAGWGVEHESGAVVLRAAWERAVSQSGAARVELLAQAVSGASGEAVVASVEVARLFERHVEARITRPMEATRYRWRAVSSGGASATSAWSGTVGAFASAGDAMSLVLVG